MKKSVIGFAIFFTAVCLVGLAGCKRSTPEKVEALVDAAYNGDVDKITKALGDGADINGKLGDKPAAAHLQGYTSKTALMVAVAKRRTEAVKALLAAKANTNITENNFNHTALHMAVETDGNAALCELLIKAGADVNAKNKDGMTPLMAACGSTLDAKIVKLLLDNKADKNAKDSSGRNAMEYIKNKPFDKFPAGEKLLK